MRNAHILLLTAIVLNGCGGHYTLTVGDHVGAVNQDAPVVVRLQRNDFFVLNLAVKDALMRFRVGDGAQRGAYTDKLGYAGTTVLSPSKPGRYPLIVDHGDSEGEEVRGEAMMFVWDPARAVVAVDADSLPVAWDEQADSAQAALKRLAENANILYLTREDLRSHGAIHDKLAAARYPDGPVLLWRRQRWHIVRGGRYKLPRVVVESRLVSQLPDLRKMFPKLSTGVGASKIAARAFAAAGMQPVVVGANVDVPKAVHRESWADLAKRAIGDRPAR